MILEAFIPILSKIVLSQLWTIIFIPVLCLMFVATVPRIIRSFITLWGR